MVERQGWGQIKPGAGALLVRLLIDRSGQPTIVRMADGSEFTVINGAGWGRDYGDRWEHVTAETADGRWEFFYLSDVEALLDPDSREILINQTPAPGET